MDMRIGNAAHLRMAGMAALCIALAGNGLADTQGAAASRRVQVRHSDSGRPAAWWRRENWTPSEEKPDESVGAQKTQSLPLAPSARMPFGSMPLRGSPSVQSEGVTISETLPDAEDDDPGGGSDEASDVARPGVPAARFAPAAWWRRTAWTAFFRSTAFVIRLR